MDKTVVMFIQKPHLPNPPAVVLNGTPLVIVEAVRCLGIQITNQLTWTMQVDSIMSKVCRKIGILRRCFRQLSLIARRLYLLSVILPDIEYAICSYVTYLSAKDRARLFTLFRRAV